MRPAKIHYMQETLDSMVNETFDRCMKSALRFPDQKRKLNTIANEVAAFQKNLMSELEILDSQVNLDRIQNIDKVQLKIDCKKREVDDRIRKLIGLI